MPFMGTRAEIEAGLARARFSGSLPRPASGLVSVIGEQVGTVTLILTGPPEYSPSVGGWENIDRIGSTAASWWKQKPLATISLPCLLHTRVTGPVEASLAQLEKIGQRVADRDPSRVKLRGDIPPSAAGAAIWRVDAMPYSSREYRSDAEQLLWWQEVTISLTQFSAGTIARAGGLKTRSNSGQRNRRVISTRQGDTLRKIALRELGSSSDWKLLRSWNKKLAKTDPDASLATGVKVNVGGKK